MNLADVKFELFEDASNIATYVGYAASVAGKETNPSAITQIAETIAQFAREKSEIRDIAIPLLGSGAGGLTPKRSLAALTKGFRRIATEGKVFNIYVLEKERFTSLSKDARKKENFTSPATASPRFSSREPIRVFISYTKTTNEHQEWVRDLARYFRENGVDARLDLWHLRPGMDLPQWMCNEIDLADRILIVCNKDYALRANGRLGGVGWEIRLVQGALLQTQASNPKKFIPIIREKIDDTNMPGFLRGVYALRSRDAKDVELRKRLLQEIYEVYEEAPPIGQSPRFVLARTNS